MAKLSGIQRAAATETALRALAPISTDTGASALTAAVVFGPFVAGDSIIVAADAGFHFQAGASDVTATTARPKFPAGVYKMVVPDGCTHVALIQSAAGAALGQVYAG